MSKVDRKPGDLHDLGPPDLDDVEIIEIVGFDDERAPVAPDAVEADGEEETDEIVLDLDGAQQEVAGATESRGGPDQGREAERGEQLLRLKADFDNFKRRTEREREASERQAAAGLVTRLLPVLDNFERAVGVLRQSQDEHAFREGVILIFKQILVELRRDGLEAIDTVGQPFDPRLHEAVATATTAEFPPHTVVEELQRGYLLHDRLLRPALVKVTLDPEDVQEPSGGAK
jgi:molecular chaperone GrpE